MNVALVVDPSEHSGDYIHWLDVVQAGLERAGYRVRRVTCPDPADLVVLTSERQQHLLVGRAPGAALLVLPGSPLGQCLYHLATL